jgi:hypothetical protein
MAAPADRPTRLEGIVSSSAWNNRAQPAVAQRQPTGEQNMKSQHAIEPPRQSGDYSGREVDCLAALRPSVADLVLRFPEALAGAMAGDISSQFAELARQAVKAGWQRNEAEASIRRLSREQEGARGTLFD